MTFPWTNTSPDRASVHLLHPLGQSFLRTIVCLLVGVLSINTSTTTIHRIELPPNGLWRHYDHVVIKEDSQPSL